MDRADKLPTFERMLEREQDSWRKRRRDDNDRKTYDEVFNRENLMRIYKLFTDGVIDKFDFPISTGKEGNVFRATTPEGELVAVKIYRTSTATFRDMAKYIQGDPRFKGITANRRKLILAWASKEFRNLQRYEEAGVRVPKPIARNQNVIVMEYIGDATEPAKELRDVILPDPAKAAETMLGFVKKGYKEAELVHADMSEFNVLLKGDELVLIDVGQAVLIGHPMSRDFLRRDLVNIARYFRKYGIDIDPEKELKEITGR